MKARLLWALKALTAWLESENVADPVARAVLEAFTACGLPAAQFGPNFDLVRAGKLADVLVPAAQALDHDHEFRTVGDVMRALRG